MSHNRSTNNRFGVFGSFASDRMLRLAILVSVFWLNAASARAMDLYSTNFDSLSIGKTASFPGANGQDQWYSRSAVDPAFGEIQDAIANSGKALHQFTSTVNQPGQQTIDSRELGAISLNDYGTISLRA